MVQWRGVVNNMKKNLSVALLSAFGAVSMLTAYPLAQDSAKDDMKDAGHATKKAAKKTGENVKEGTEKGAKATADGTKKAAKATAHGTKKGVHKAADATAD